MIAFGLRGRHGVAFAHVNGADHGAVFVYDVISARNRCGVSAFKLRHRDFTSSGIIMRNRVAAYTESN